MSQDNRDNRNKERTPFEDVIVGRNAVIEALRSGREIDRLLVAKGTKAADVIAKVRDRGIPVKDVDSRKLDTMCGSHHQGIAAVAACKEFATVDDLFAVAEERGEAPFFVVCDELEDPHNLGAIVRTAEATGAHGVIIPKRRSVGLTAAVYKASAGAIEYVPVARVTNITDTLKDLKKRGLWIYGLDMDGEPWCATDLTGAAAFVVGSEGRGLSRLVKEQCDFVLSLPMSGKVNSLNASVACSLMLYETARQRAGIVARNPK